jgi:cyclopropane fatty-acyl-phospholipid synthase-like methyltransferase
LPEIVEKHVLQLRCDGGEETAELVALGALVTAVDGSSEEIELARKRAPDAVFVHGDLHALPLELRRGRFDLVYAADAFDGVQDLVDWAHGVAAALRPGGQLFAYGSHPVTDCVDHLGHWRDDYFEGGLQLGVILDTLSAAGLGLTRLIEFQSLYNWLQRDRRVPWELALIAERRPE